MKAIKEKKRFRKDLAKMKASGKNLDLLWPIVKTIAEEKPLDPKLNDHPLEGNWKGCRELHIKPDWLLIYRVSPDLLTLERTGSHSELFG